MQTNIRYWKDRIKMFLRKTSSTTPMPKKELEAQIVGTAEDVSASIPKIIWTFWNTAEIDSEITKMCLARIKELHSDYTFHLLSFETINEWLPCFSYENADLPMANISDIIRLSLLEKYGGIYLDASILLFDSLDWICDIQKSTGVDLVAYFSKYNTVNNAYPMVENWCLASIKNGAFIRFWKSEYENCILSANPRTYYKDNKIVPASEAVLGYDYYKCYFAAQVVIRQKVEGFKIALLEADKDAFLYSLSVKNKWSDINFSDILMINRRPLQLPHMAKLISTSRKTVDDRLARKYYKKDSILGFLIAETFKKRVNRN